MKTDKVFVDVAPAIPLNPSDRQLFTYTAPQSVQLRQLVAIPFGSRRVAGIVMNIHTRQPPYPTKEAIVGSHNAAITASQLACARWIADTMHGGLGYTARLFFPPVGSPPRPENVSSTIESPTLHSLAKTTQLLLDPAKPTVLIEASSVKRIQALSELAAAVAANKKQVAMIVPEVSLIGPLAEQLAKHIPPGRLTTLFSGQPAGHARRVWHGLRDQSISVVVGTQKALFLPWQALGLLVIEEAFFPTHKLWDQYPRLSNVHVAPHFARSYHAPLLYAGALLSLHLHYQLKAKKYTAAHINSLVAKASDISYEQTDRAAHYLLPHQLLKKLKIWHQQKKRIFILYNKKGAWQVIICRACHKALVCPKCKTPFTVHVAQANQPGKAGLPAGALAKEGKRTYTLRCKQCGHQEPKPASCPVCHKRSLQFVRPGIETIAALIRSNRIKPVLIEAATSHRLNAARVGRTSVLLGTQAAFRLVPAGSLDYVVWLYPEDTLQFPDARSREKARYLLTRLAGLTKNDTVVAVSRQPRTTMPELTLSTDKLWEAELKMRRRLSYPPVQDMVKLTVRAKTDAQASKQAEKIRLAIDQHIAEKKSPVRILGPFTALGGLKRGERESHVLLLGPLAKLAPLYRDVKCDSADYMPERIL